MHCGKRQNEEERVVRNRLVLEACLPPRDMVISRSGLLPRIMSGSMLTSMTHDATKIHRLPGIWVTIYGHVGVPGPCAAGAMLTRVSCAVSQGRGDVQGCSTGPCLGPWPYSSQGLC